MRETGERGCGAGEWVLRKLTRPVWVGLGGVGRRALGREGRGCKDEKDPSQLLSAALKRFGQEGAQMGKCLWMHGKPSFTHD